MVLVLLGGLAYGSFAFGKYVLSNKLFGDSGKSSALRTVSRSTSEASAVTRHTNWKGDKPRVEVRVLPNGEEDTSGSDASVTQAVPDSSVAGDTSPGKLGVRRFDDASVEYSLGDESGKRRRRKRSHHKDSDNATKPTPTPANNTARSDGGTPEGDGQNSEDGDSSSIHVSSQGSHTSKPSTTRRSRPQPRHESPVPQPEDSGSSSSGDDSGDISPVPQPE